jgi:penicillin amidase
MRARLRLLPLLVLAALPLAVAAHGCGHDPDTPTPALPSYSHDAIDDVAINQKIVMEGLAAPVRVVRDKGGMVHIYARSLKDASMAQGYMMARDRAPQLELFRRASEGRLAEWKGGAQPDLAKQDLTLRAIGLRRTGAAIYAGLDAKGDAKIAIDAYSAGITAYFKEIRANAKIPAAWLAAFKRADFTDWDPVSTLAIARLQTYLLSYTAGDEVDVTMLYDAFHKTFDATTDPALQARQKMALDAMRFAPALSVPVLSGGAPAATTAASIKPGPARGLAPARKPIAPALGEQARAFFAASHQMFPGMHANSNNWVVSATKSADGHALVASDPHLPLQAPSIWYMNSLHVISDDPTQQFDAAGVSFAGIPSVVLGANKYVAWGATVAFFDVNDVYADKIVDGKVTIAGVPTAVVRITEDFDYGDGKKVPIVFETIPGHGVVLPKFANNKLVARDSATEQDVLVYRWTGMEPSGEILGFIGVQKAKTAHDAKAAMDANFEVGAQNFVIGDVNGHIAYTTHARVPTRPAGALKWDAKNFKGQLPCLVIPGDQGLEWNGRVEDKQLPQAEDPKEGYIATANSDQYGLVFDNDPSNDPVYLGCLWDEGYREARIHERLDAKEKVSIDDVQSIQADAKSPLGTALSKHFVKAIERAEAARASGTIPADLARVLADPLYAPAKVQFAHDALVAWAAADFEAASGVTVDGDPVPTATQETASRATTIFNAAMVRLVKLTFDDEAKAMGNPPWMQIMKLKGVYRMLEKPADGLATADASGESVLWDDLATTDFTESKDERLIRALIEAIDWLGKQPGHADPSSWQWGNFHTIRFGSMLPGTESTLSIPSTNSSKYPNGYPRHGDYANVDRGDPAGSLGSFDFTVDTGAGPSQRFAANLSTSSVAVQNAIPGGNVWDSQSAHFDDMAQLWRQNLTRAIPQTQGEVKNDAEERIDLMPF